MTRWLMRLGRVALGAVFVYAAYSKLLSVTFSPFHAEWRPWALFALSIDSYQLLPEWAVIAVARGLPWLELALGVLLISGVFLRIVATTASLLLVGFIGVMLRAYFRGLGIDCGCFGVGEALSVKTLVRDGLLVLVSLAVTAGAFLTRQKTGDVPPLTREPQPTQGRTE